MLALAAYNRSDFLERRRAMMEWWSNHLEKASYGNLSMTAKVLNHSNDFEYW
jgi:hypothetical protein